MLSGDYVLGLAWAVAVWQIVVSVVGLYRKNLTWIAQSGRAAGMVFVLVSLAFALLANAFYHNDFSLQYVAQNSNIYLPWYYKLSAVWAGHEGSLLLWVWILSLWNALLAWRVASRFALPPHFRAKVLAVMGFICVGFLAFVRLTSSPFTRRLPPPDGIGFPLQGKDLNPLLQDVGLISHPPMLYMGYVGFSVAFAFMVAALWSGRLDAQWARWVRPWTMAAWAFLTLGIALGSWWAYYELGWGGWWFWDPVENASLMPWLAATALIHSLSATQKRGVFKVWTAFLAITTFSLSLIGTFLVRSGVLTSVHAFAADASRGIFILLLLGAISGAAFVLLIVRAPRLFATGEFDWLSREMGLLLNNVLLSTACLVVFIGTLTPLLYDVLGWSRISIGAPYFNAKMLWVLILLLVLMTFAPYLQWKRDRWARLRLPLLAVILLGGGLSVAVNSRFTDFSGQATVLLALILTAVLTTLFDAYQQTSKRRFRLPNAAYWAMFVAHLGFLLCCSGIILSSFYSLKKDVYARRDSVNTLGNYRFTLTDIQRTGNALYDAVSVDFLLQTGGDDGNRTLAVLSPEKRYYHLSQMPMSETALLPRLGEDVYIALGEPQNEHLDAWSVRLQIKPFIRWIWLGAMVMACAAWFVVIDKRYRRKPRETNNRTQVKP